MRIRKIQIKVGITMPKALHMVKKYLANRRYRVNSPLFLFIGLGSLFLGCSLMPSRKALRECRFTVETVSFRGITDLGTRWTVQVKAFNPNRSDTHLNRLELAFRNGLDTLMQAQSQNAFTLKSKDTTAFLVEAFLPYSAMPQVLLAMKSQAKSDIEVVGDAFIATPVGEWRIKQAVKQRFAMDWNKAAQAMEEKLGLPGVRSWLGF